MIYVISDVHGEYEKYHAMLKQISFSENDTLFVLGDAVDRGPEPIRLLQDMASRDNVYLRVSCERKSLKIMPIPILMQN